MSLSSGNSSKERTKFLKEQYKKFLDQKQFVANIPDPKNLNVWHITMKGPKKTAFDGGYYHFLFDLTRYPDAPPRVESLNENGSFHTNQRMCIETVSDVSPGCWIKCDVIQLVTALQLAFTTTITDIRHGSGYIVDISTERQQNIIRNLAKQSTNWVCPKCNKKISEYEIEQD